MSDKPAGPNPPSAALAQDELDSLLKNAADARTSATATTGSAASRSGSTTTPAAAAATVEIAPPAAAPDADMAAEMAAAIAAEASGAASSATPFSGPNFDTEKLDASLAGLELLDDVDLSVKVELGRADMYIEDVLRLGVGSVITLDRLAGDPVDIYVNDRLVARGEVLVLNENFCVRVNDILSAIPEPETAR